MITNICLSDIVLDPAVTLVATRFIVTKFYFLLTERIYVFFMVVRTNSDHFLVLPLRVFIGELRVFELTLIIVQVLVSVTVPWVTGLLAPRLGFNSRSVRVRFEVATKGHSLGTSVFPCEYHSTNATH